MDPKHGGGGGGGRVMLAPGTSAGASSYGFPGRERSPTPVPSAFAFPRVDDHLVEPEISRDIVIRGERIEVQGADEEHGDAHACLDFVLLPHVRKENTTSSDLLTRVTKGSDFATDASVRRGGKDPLTGARYLEEISFEVINEQSDARARTKAEDLAFRGIRRIFAIFVKKGVVCEWSRTKKEFVECDLNGFIEDSSLIRPISVRALLDRTHAEMDVARALIEKDNPEILKLKERIADEAHKSGLDEGHKKGLDEGHKKGLDEGHKKGLDEGHKSGLDEGELQGRRRMLRELVAEQFGELPALISSRIDGASVEQIRGWMKKLRHATTLDEVFAIED